MVAVENSSTTQKDAESLYRQAAAILSEAMAEAASLALVIAEKWGEPLQTVCRKIANDAGMPDAWEALAARGRRLAKQNRRSEQDSDRRAESEWESRTATIARKAISERPEIIRDAIQADPELAERVYRDSAETLRNQPERKARLSQYWDQKEAGDRAAGAIDAQGYAQQAKQALGKIEQILSQGVDDTTADLLRKDLDEIIDIVSRLSSSINVEVMA